MTESQTVQSVAPELRVVVLTGAGCQACRATYRQLGAGGIEPILVDVAQYPDVPTVFGHEVGHQALPIVIGPTGHWSGHRPERISALIQHVNTHRQAAA